MSTWTKQKLGDVFKLEYGKGLIAKERIPGDYSVYGSSGRVGTHCEYLVDGPGIIIGRKGSVGEVYFSKQNFFPIDTAYYIEKNDGKYDIRFLYYFLKSQNLKRLQGDVGVPGLNRTTLHNEIVFFLTDLPTQKRVASILSAYDDLIENNEKRIRVLEEMAQLLYTEWFVKFKFPGHEKVKMVDSGTEYGKIPEGWEIKNIKRMAQYISRGLSPAYDEGGDSTVINQKCIRNNKLNIDIARRQNKTIPDEKKLRFGDILINSTGVGTLGRVAQVYQSLESCTVDSHVTIVRPLFEFIDYLGLAAISHRDDFAQLGVGATGQTELNKSSVEGFILMKPPRTLITYFSQVMRPNRQKSIVLEHSIKNLSKTRDLLISQLVTGKRELK